MATSTPVPRIDYAAELAFFLLEQTGSVCGKWEGRMSAAEQRALFGRFLGKGVIEIDGTEETLRNRVSVCYGMDWDYRNTTRFRQLQEPELVRPAKAGGRVQVSTQL